jgi:hypothetical protein
MALTDGHVRRFLSPSEYESGRSVGIWACVYLAVTAFLIVSAVPEGSGDGSFMLGLAFVGTLPLSVVVLSAQGMWMLAALAVCALVNAFVFWVAFRGSAHYPRHDRTARVPVVAPPKGRRSKRAARTELGDSLHPRKKVGEGYGWFHN